MPIELGARSSGYIATHLVDAVTCSRQTMLGRYERVLHGQRLTDENARPRRSSMLFFYDFPTGIGKLDSTRVTRFLPRGIESIAANRSELVRGRRFRQLEDDADRPGFEILVGTREALRSTRSRGPRGLTGDCSSDPRRAPTRPRPSRPPHDALS